MRVDEIDSGSVAANHDGGKVPRTYSLASAPLRLLSHSFHSTANTYPAIPTIHPQPHPHDAHSQHQYLAQHHPHDSSQQHLPLQPFPLLNASPSANPQHHHLPNNNHHSPSFGTSNNSSDQGHHQVSFQQHGIESIPTHRLPHGYTHPVSTSSLSSPSSSATYSAFASTLLPHYRQHQQQHQHPPREQSQLAAAQSPVHVRSYTQLHHQSLEEQRHFPVVPLLDQLHYSAQNQSFSTRYSTGVAPILHHPHQHQIPVSSTLPLTTSSSRHHSPLAEQQHLCHQHRHDSNAHYSLGFGSSSMVPASSTSSSLARSLPHVTTGQPLHHNQLFQDSLSTYSSAAGPSGIAASSQPSTMTWSRSSNAANARSSLADIPQDPYTSLYDPLTFERAYGIAYGHEKNHEVPSSASRKRVRTTSPLTGSPVMSAPSTLAPLTDSSLPATAVVGKRQAKEKAPARVGRKSAGTSTKREMSLSSMAMPLPSPLLFDAGDCLQQEREQVIERQGQEQEQSGMMAVKLNQFFQPFDIRYEIFRRLTLSDLYNCQLTSKLFRWATSDQSIWKSLALDLIQGEFYFDIPSALPPTIPNWKYFCKRHFLRQQNWRRGEVQDVITLNDDYKKLTTLQVMAPYILTGCSDGRVHLWNLNSRTLLHRFQIHGEITWVEHLQDKNIVAGLGYDVEHQRSEIRLFSTVDGSQVGFYQEEFWDLAICAINSQYLVASDGLGRYTTWDWKTNTKVAQFTVKESKNEEEIINNGDGTTTAASPSSTSITEALYLVKNTILELHYDGLIRLFSITTGECYGRFSLDKILPNHQVSFCWLHNDFSLVVWEASNTMAHIRLPLLQDAVSASRSLGTNGKATAATTSSVRDTLDRPISQEEWDNQGAEVFWRHKLTHTCNFAAMGGGRFQLLYVQIFENLMDQVPIRVHSLRQRQSRRYRTIHSGMTAAMDDDEDEEEEDEEEEDEGYGWQHGEYVTARSLNPELEKIIQGLRPSRIDCDPEHIVVGLVEGGIRLLQFAPSDEALVRGTEYDTYLQPLPSPSLSPPTVAPSVFPRSSCSTTSDTAEGSM